MRPGIIIQHAREVSNEGSLVRSDVTGFLGLVPEGRWPKGAAPGDFLEMPLGGYAQFAQSRARHFFDPVTRRAVRAFFENGGKNCRVFGLCVKSQDDLIADDPFHELFIPLLDRLRGEEDLGLLVMPVLAYLPVEYVNEGYATVKAQPVIELLLRHCEEMNNRFMILDAPKDLHQPALTRWLDLLRRRVGDAASYGAVYYPWLRAGDELLAPSGTIAGVYARLEAEHAPFGVRWPPANEALHGVTHPSIELRWAEAGNLNDEGVNTLITQPTRGPVVWGARTLSRDPKWMHINSRRIVSLISEQLRRDSEWVVFEHQRPELWQVVARMVRSRLDQFWSGGLLTGEQAGTDYLVQCDEELNPAKVRDAGIVNVRVVVRPVSTAERIVVDLRLGTGSAVGGG